MNCTNCGSALSAPAGYCGICGQLTAPAAWQSDATTQFAAVRHGEPYPPPPAPYEPPGVPAMPTAVPYRQPGYDGAGQPTVPFYGGPDMQQAAFGQPVAAMPQLYSESAPPPPYGPPYGQPAPPPPPFGQPPPPNGQVYGPPPIQPYQTGPAHPYQIGYPDTRVLQRPANRLSIVALVLAGLALLVLPIVTGVAGIALGAAARRREEPLGKAATITAIVTTALSMIIGAVLRLRLL